MQGFVYTCEPRKSSREKNGHFSMGFFGAKDERAVHEVFRLIMNLTPNGNMEAIKGDVTPPMWSLMTSVPSDWWKFLAFNRRVDQCLPAHAHGIR
jgi:hypothetical protein